MPEFHSVLSSLIEIFQKRMRDNTDTFNLTLLHQFSVMLLDDTQSTVIAASYPT
jgi:hypothetical protein